MTDVLGQAVLELTTDQTKLDTGLKSVGQQLTGAGAAITGLTAPIESVGLASVKMAVDFERRLDLIVGLVGVSRQQVNDWKDDIYALAKETAKSPQELAEALYFVTSSGIEASQAIEVLRASAQAAAAGLGETKSVADAVTSAMNAYGAENLSAAQATSVLVAMVREGKGEAAEFAPVLGRVIPIAAQLGVTFEQVGAAMAFFTRFGIPAAEAADALRQILQSMVKPARQEAEALAQVGLTFSQLQSTLREKGLLATLQMLDERVGGNTEALAKIFPRVQGLSALMTILGENASMADEMFASLAATTDKDLATAFGAVAEGPGFKMKQALNELRVEMVELGDTLLPLVADIIVPGAKKGAAAFRELVEAFQSLPEPVQRAIVVAAAFAGALGPLVMMVGLAVTAFASLQMVAPGATAAMLGFTGSLLSIAGPAAAAIALALLLGTDLKDLAIVIGVAAAAFVAFRMAVAAASFATLIAETTAATAGFSAMGAATATAGAGLGAMGAMMSTLPGALAALAIAFIGVDFAVGKLTGRDLIGWVTGAGDAAKKQAAYLREFGNAVQAVNDAVARGGTVPEAAGAELQRLIGLIDDASIAHQRYLEQLEREGTAISDKLRDATAAGIPHLKEHEAALLDVIDLLPTVKEKYYALATVMAQLREMGVEPTKEIKTAWEEVGATFRAEYPPMLRMHEEFTGLVNVGGLLVPVVEGLTWGVKQAGDAADGAAGDYNAFLTALKTTTEASDNLATIVVSKLGLGLRQLELEKRKNELEALGDAITEAGKAELGDVNAELEAMSRYTQDVTLRLKMVGQRLYDAFGSDAAERINTLTGLITDMPKDVAIQVITALDTMSADQVSSFIYALQTLKVTVPVAFAISTMNYPAEVVQAVVKYPESLLGRLVKGVGEISLAAQKGAPNLDAFKNAASSAGAAAGGASEKALTLEDALSDAKVTAEEAAKLGLDPMAAAAAELGAETQQTAEEIWRAQVEVSKLAIALGDKGLTGEAFRFAVMVGIARGELKDTGTVLEEVMKDDIISLAEAIKAKLNPAQAAALEYTRQRAKAEQAAAAKAYDDQKALQELALALGAGATKVHTVTRTVQADLGALITYMSTGLMSQWQTGAISQKAYEFGQSVTEALTAALAQGGGALSREVADLQSSLMSAWQAGYIDQASYQMGISIIDAVASGIESGTSTITTSTEEAVAPLTLQTLKFWVAAKKANEGTLGLTDAIELGLTPAEAATIQAMADVVKKHQELQQAIFDAEIEMDTFVGQMRELPGPAQQSVALLHDLGMRLGDPELGRKALDFLLAMQEMKNAFGETAEAAADVAYEIGTELLSQLQSAVQQLLGGPTVETAQLQLKIDTLEYQKSLIVARGATDEQTKAIDDEIDALQKRMAVYTAEHRVLQDRATLQDKTLPTERELLVMARDLTTAIGLQSGQVKSLTVQTYLQAAVTGIAKDRVATFGDVAKGATDYMGWFTRGLGDAADVVIGGFYRVVGAADAAATALAALQQAPGYQAGGMAAGLIMVGEEGPELIRVPVGTQVFSREETEAMLPRFLTRLRVPERAAVPAGVVIDGPVVEFSGPVTVRENADIDRIVHRVNTAFYDSVRELSRARGQ